MSLPEPAINGPIRILRLPEICEITGLSRATICLQTQERFPQRIRITARAVGSVEQEVQTWLAQRIASSRSQLLFHDDENER